MWDVTILDGSRSKQSFRFADTPVSLLFEEVSESRNFIHKELFRFQGYEELMSVANTNSELPGLFNSPRSNSIFLILDNHFIHTHNSICFIPDILVSYGFYFHFQEETQKTPPIMANLCIQSSYQTIHFMLLNSLR